MISVTNQTAMGFRIVYELKKDAVSNVVLNKLYQYSISDIIHVNNVALVKGSPIRST